MWWNIIIFFFIFIIQHVSNNFFNPIVQYFTTRESYVKYLNVEDLHGSYVLLSSGNDHYYIMKLRRNRLDVKIPNLKLFYKIVYNLKLRT